MFSDRTGELRLRRTGVSLSRTSNPFLDFGIIPSRLGRIHAKLSKDSLEVPGGLRIANHPQKLVRKLSFLIRRYARDVCDNRLSLRERAGQFGVFAELVGFLSQVKGALRAAKHESFDKSLVDSVLAICLRGIEPANFQVAEAGIREHLRHSVSNHLILMALAHRRGHVDVHMI